MTHTLLPLRLSASAVRDFDQCALRFALSHLSPLDPRERQPVTLLAFGQIIHAVIANFFGFGGWENVDSEGLATLLGVHWRGDMYANEGIAMANYERAAELLERFYSLRYPEEVVSELGVERRHAWRRYHRGIMAVGRIDRACQLADGSLVLVDYKTGRRRGDAETLRSDVQALFYRSLAGEAYRHLAPSRIVVAFVYLAAGMPAAIEFEHEEFLAGWERIQAVATAIRAAMARVIAGVPVQVAFLPNAGVQCQLCPVRGHCDAIAYAAKLEGGVA